MLINMTVNGDVVQVDVPPMKRLLDVLREELGLTGTKEGCGEGECGACSVIVDGRVVNACLIPAIQGTDTEILTIEGLSNANELHPLQTAFVEHIGTQCGICTPGMILASKVLLDDNPAPTRPEIREAVAGNLCRCTGYQKIIDSVEEAAKVLRTQAGGDHA